jgi:hypothetical protein
VDRARSDRTFAVVPPSGKVDRLVHARVSGQRPRSVDTALRRYATWTNGRQPLDLLLAVFRNATDAHAQTWAHAAVLGLQNPVGTGRRDDRLKAVTIIILAAEAARPE